MAMSDEDRRHLEKHRLDFTFTDRDSDIEADRYSEGRYVTRSMRRRNSSIKHDKQWRTSQQERSVLRFTIGG